MDIKVRVPEAELGEVMDWAQQHAEEDTTDNEGGTYEQGVYDALRWALGFIQSRPDH
jgi:hypothetical protein